MATITHAGTAVWTTTAGNKTVPAASGFAVAVGDLIVVVAPATGVATSAVTDDNPDGLGTYTKIGSSRTGFSTSGDLSIWVRNFLIGSATNTTWTLTQTSSTGGGGDVFRVSGMTRTGANAVRQSAGQSSGTAGGTPAPVMGAAVLTGNPVIMAVCNGTNPGGVTARSSPAYTRDTNLGYNTPTTGLDTCRVNSGETGTTLTWGGTSATAFASIAIELDTSAAEQSPVLEAAGFWPFLGVGNQDTINSVTATVNQWQSVTTFGQPTYRLWDGIANAQLGSDIAGTVATGTGNTDSPQWTGITYAQLLDIRFRILANQGAAAAAATQSVDWVALTVNYTPAGGYPPVSVTSPRMPVSALPDSASQAAFA